jgi:hypothetical protein
MVDKFEEYKLFVEDTARFSERRQTVNNIYVAVNSIILSAIAFLVKDAGFVPVWRAFVVMSVLAAGIVICMQWYKQILKYKRLVGFRIKHLKAIEDTAEMATSYKMYHQEDELYPVDDAGHVISGKGLNFSDRELWLPRVFIIVYSVFLIGFVAMLLFARYLM